MPFKLKSRACICAQVATYYTPIAAVVAVGMLLTGCAKKSDDIRGQFAYTKTGLVFVPNDPIVKEPHGVNFWRLAATDDNGPQSDILRPKEPTTGTTPPNARPTPPKHDIGPPTAPQRPAVATCNDPDACHDHVDHDPSRHDSAEERETIHGIARPANRGAVKRAQRMTADAKARLRETRAEGLGPQDVHDAEEYLADALESLDRARHGLE